MPREANAALDSGLLAEPIVALEDFLASAAKSARGGETALQDIAAGEDEACPEWFSSAAQAEALSGGLWQSPAYSHKMPNGLSWSAVPRNAG